MSKAGTRTEHHGDCSQYQLEIAPKRPVRHVDVVQTRHLLERDGTPPEDLPEPRYSWLHIQAPACPILHPLVLVEDKRARSDKRHLTAKNIDQLWEFVERQP